MKKKTLKYLAFFGNFNSSGIIQKIDNTVEAASGIGYDSESKFYQNRLFGLITCIRDLFLGREDIIIIRSYDLFMPLLFPVLLFRRFKGTKLILDVPTPRIIQLQELKFDQKTKFHILMRTILNYLSFTWILIPFNRIIQYAEEGRWFSFGVNHKTIKMGNGIKISQDLPLINLDKNTGELQLIGVATLAAWHGYDRLIEALAVIKHKYPNYRFKLKIVGEGAVLPSLKELAKKHNLDNVVFTGALHGENLTLAFQEAHLGVASLGLFRIGLQEAAILKTREYMARGLCVLGAGKDPDFPEESPFRFLVSNDESIDSIVEMLLSLKIEDLPDPKEVRKFAENNLSYVSKIAKIIG